MLQWKVTMVLLLFAAFRNSTRDLSAGPLVPIHHQQTLIVSSFQLGEHCLTGAACRFCDRIIPVQLTCGLTAQALKGAAARIAALHAGTAVQAAAGSPTKLAGRASPMFSQSIYQTLQARLHSSTGHAASLQ